MEKAVIYSRISTNETKQDSARQVSDLERAADLMGVEIAGEFIDTISGSSLFNERPEASKLLNFIESKGINLILVTEFSRLGRDEIDTMILARDFADNKIAVYEQVSGTYIVKADGIIDTSSKIFTTLRSIMAQSEKDQLVQRTTSGVRYAQRKGHWVGAVPKGYKIQNKKLTPHETESQIVKDIFDDYLKTKTLHQTTKIINQRYRLKLEAPNIKKILQNTVYIGHKIVKSGIKIETPQLVDTTTFEAVQKYLGSKTNKAKDKGRTHTNIFENVAFCAECGQPVQLWATGYHTIRCKSYSMSRKGAETSCSGFVIGENVLVSSIIDFCHTVGDTENFLAGRVEILENQVFELNADIKTKRDEIEQLERKKERDLALYDREKISIAELDRRDEETEKRKQQLKTEIDRISTGVTDLRLTIARIKTTTDTPELSDINSPEKAKNFIQSNIIKIDISGASEHLTELNRLTGVKASDLLKIDVKANTFSASFYLPKFRGRGQENIYVKGNVSEISEILIDSYPFLCDDLGQPSIQHFKRLLN